MPLPSHAFTLSGACNCRTLTYRISVPPLSSRPLHPNYSSSSGKPPIHLPYTFTDHCNDCRRATGSILPAWITTPIETVTCLITPPNPQSNGSRRTATEILEDRSEDEWHPASEIFDSNGDGAGVLSFYPSSPGIVRAFCKHCGTPLVWMSLEGGKSDFDIWYGTLEREWLDGEEAVPERHCMWGFGLGWVRRWCDQGDGGGLERHENGSMNEGRWLPGEKGKEDGKGGKAHGEEIVGVMGGV